MEMFTLLKEMEKRIKEQDSTEKEKEAALDALQEVRVAVEEYVDKRIRETVMSPEMKFYAPDYDSWHQAVLNSIENRMEDCAIALYLNYAETDLDNLWQNSHVGYQMKEEDVRDLIMRKIGELKMLELMKKNHMSTMDSVLYKRSREGHIARIIGLYNVLYE